MFGVMGAFGGPFDLVVAGINPGENIGRAVYHSGTVGAAVTARCRHVTGVAVSQAVQGPSVEGQGEEDSVLGQHWETAASVAGTVVGALLTAPPREAMAVNVNVPNVEVDQLRKWRSTTLATLPARALASATLRPKTGHTGAYRIEIAWGEPAVLGADTDGGAIAAGEVSITLLGPYTETDVARGPGLAAALSGRWSRAG